MHSVLILSEVLHETIERVVKLLIFSSGFNCRGRSLRRTSGSLLLTCFQLFGLYFKLPCDLGNRAGTKEGACSNLRLRRSKLRDVASGTCRLSSTVTFSGCDGGLLGSGGGRCVLTRLKEGWIFAAATELAMIFENSS